MTRSYTLDDKDVDLIVNALAQRPWLEANALINKLLQQANTTPDADTPTPRRGRPPKAQPTEATAAH